jgi:hippurate hydrolase
MKKIIQTINENIQQFKKWRHDLHQHPELAFEEHRTAKKIAEYLKLIGVDEITTDVGDTGVVGIIREGEGPSIALRADFDALPISETGAHHYISTNDGVMHACGHDGHTVMLLAAAEYLVKNRPFKGTVVLVFQGGEETLTGAPAMLKDNLLTRFPFESIYTLHSWPGAPTNAMFVNQGPVMASVNNFDITITGAGGHAAMPHLTPDPIVAGAEIITSLQSLVSRQIDPQDPLVLSCTAFHAGRAYNVIPNEVKIKGTARFLKHEMVTWLPERMNQIISGVARAHDVSANLDFQSICPPTLNTKKESLLAKKVIDTMLGENLKGKEKAVSMGSDDFCFYLEEVPGAYVYIGNGEDSASLHHSQYNFNDEAIPVGAAFYVNLVILNSKQ